MRRKVAVLMAFVMLAFSVCACSAGKSGTSSRYSDEEDERDDDDADDEEESTSKESKRIREKKAMESSLAEEAGESGDEDGSGNGESDGNSASGENAGGQNAENGDGDDSIVMVSRRATPWNTIMDYSTAEVVPNVPYYTVNADLSNIENLNLFYLQDAQKQMLAQNGFVVAGGAGSEFFEVYEDNRYQYIPNFITVDSLMHTYHLYFSYLMKNIEKTYLSDCVRQLSERMLAGSEDVYADLKGTEWEDAARTNLTFFTVASSLMDDSTQVPADVQDIVNNELQSILQASNGVTGAHLGLEIDYTQYKPRGYYEGDAQLERYFRTMMWYGRAHFEYISPQLQKSAALITMMLSNDSQAYELWKSIYDVTSFFAGSSDDLGVDEYAPVLADVYGAGADADEISSAGEDAFDEFYRSVGRLRLPQINANASGGLQQGFRFMGQRFTIDASIMQLLVHDSVQGRMLPDVLDVPAALGSDVALDILDEMGDTDYEGYSDTMDMLRQSYPEDDTLLWASSLYSGWLNTLRPLFEEKGEGYPMFMQSTEWLKKDLECFAGSYTELKHDTILYTKQVMAEMGGDGWVEPPDDRGYVEPEPLVFARFAELSDKTAKGLREYGMLSSTDDENLSRLSQMAKILLEISKKELRNETLSDDEYEFIRSYGGDLEHFWQETVKDVNGGGYVATQECPASLVVDVATGEGKILEMATDTPDRIYVAVMVDGKLKIATGSVYSFYQFEWDERLTDSQWQSMCRGQMTGPDMSEAKPDWTESYRCEWRY